MATSRGIDVSAYQGVQDWTALAKGGLTFAFAKASEGEHSRDQRFDAHITGIIAAGLIPGAYHYGWPAQDPAAEAANYVAAVRPYARAGFIHVLDLERRNDGANYSGRNATQIRIWAEAWITAVKRAYPGQRVGVYTSASDISTGHMPGNADFLWYPAYPSGAMSYAQAEGRPRPTPGGKQPLIWQFTSTPVDRNLAYLSPAALRAWALGDTTPEADMPLTPDEIDAIATAAADKVRWLKVDDPFKTDNSQTTLGGLWWETATRVAKLAAQPALALTDAQVGALATKLATNPTFAASIAEQVAEKLAARLQS